MKRLNDLKVKIFADGADLKQIEALAADPIIAGFTTNPTLMRKAGVTDYEDFARRAAAMVAPRPISFEVFADDLDAMVQQARVIAGWGNNIYVKVPITNTQGVATVPILQALSRAGIRLNVTAIFTAEQVKAAMDALADGSHFVSVFAGRIADTGRDPADIVSYAVALARHGKEVIWASPREVWNVWQADACGCHVITATPDVLGKLALAGKDLAQYSLETVRMFREDAVKAGYAIAAPSSWGGAAYG